MLGFSQRLSRKIRAVSKRRPNKCKPLVFWGERVVFEDTPSDVPGSVVVNSEGYIQSCRAHDTEESARQWASLNDHEFFPLDKGVVLSPGLIDVHCHISQLGRNFEGYESATMAAAAGGITTLIGMPLNSIPSTTTPEALRMEIDAALKTSIFADVGYWGGLVPSNINSPGVIRELVNQGVLGFKAFLSPLPPSAGFEAVEPSELVKGAELVGSIETDIPILVHSELMSEHECEEALVTAYNAQSSTSNYKAHVESRPPQWERRAVRVVCEDCTPLCRMHVVHLSDAGCLEYVAAAKENPISGSNLTVETCPHYLMFDSNDIPDGSTKLKCFPPIRDTQNREKLWEKGLSSGLIDMIGSDHSPCSPGLRLTDTDNVKDAWAGIAGLQYQLPVTWTEAIKRGYSVKDMSKWWSERPSKLPAGLSSVKGGIKEGNVADLTAWDPQHLGIPTDYSKERHRWPESPLAILQLQGRVLGTWLGGRRVYDGDSDTILGLEDSPGRILLGC